MLRGCLFALGLWAALSYGYYLWLVDIFVEPATYIIPIVVGFLTMCCLGAWGNAWTAWRDLGRLRRAQDGTMPRGGQVIAVSGPIQPIKQALPTPFRHLDCVLCEYDIQRPFSGNTSPDSSPGSYFAGFMMIPCAIHTDRGPVPLLGFPIVDKYLEVLCQGAESADNARNFLQNTHFEDRSGVKIVSVMSVFGELWSDDDGMIFKNMRFSKATMDEIYPPQIAQNPVEQAGLAGAVNEGVDNSQNDFRGNNETNDDDDNFDEDDDDDEAGIAAAVIPPKLPRLIEKYIPVGEVVTLFGVYQEMSGGIGPTGRSGPPSRLFRRSAEEQEKVSRRSVFSNLLGGAIGLAVVHALLFGIILLYQNSEEAKRHKQRRAKQQPVVAAKLSPSFAAYQRFVVIVPEVES